MLDYLIWLLFFGLFVAILGTFALGGFLAAPWVPLWKKDIRRMLKLAQLREGELAHDLGAGDGRIMICAVQDHGAQAIGYEIAVLPYLLGRIRILFSGKRHQMTLKYGDFFRANLGDADVICAFLTPQAMAKLKPKFEAEAKPGCRIVSYAFSVPGWQPTSIDKPNSKTTAIYLYQR